MTSKTIAARLNDLRGPEELTIRCTGDEEFCKTLAEVAVAISPASKLYEDFYIEADQCHGTISIMKML